MVQTITATYLAYNTMCGLVSIEIALGGVQGSFSNIKLFSTRNVGKRLKRIHHLPWTEDSYSEVCLLGRAVDRVVTSNNHSAGDSWCTGGRVGRQGRWGGLAGSELEGLRSGPRK